MVPEVSQTITALMTIQQKGNGCDLTLEIGVKPKEEKDGFKNFLNHPG